MTWPLALSILNTAATMYSWESTVNAYVYLFMFVYTVFLEIVGEKSRHSLQENLHLITARLQVIWGKHDQVTKHLLNPQVLDIHLLYNNCGPGFPKGGISVPVPVQFFVQLCLIHSYHHK